MGQSFKAVLQLVLLVAAIVTVFAWGAPSHATPTVWAYRFAVPLVAIAIGWSLWKSEKQVDLVPDMLSSVTRNFFERNGFCFAFVTVVENGVCWAHIYFQNRYERACTARVFLQAPVKSFSRRRFPLQGINVEIPCPGAGYGVYRIPWPIHAKLQGKSINCEVGASVKYEHGAGKLLRFREGLRTGGPSSATFRGLATAGLLMVGVVRLGSPAKSRRKFPAGVADVVPPGLEPSFEILWQPDVPTKGFPVVLTTTSTNNQ